MTTQRTQLTVQPRIILGKKVKQLRKAGIIPASVYGNDKASVNVQVLQKNFAQAAKVAGDNGLIDLLVEGESKPRPVLVDDVLIHPLSDATLHVTFREVNLNEKVKANIAVETIGESEAVKNGGVLVVAYNELEVEALPTDLPEKFEVDISKLKAIGDDIKVSDLVFDRNKVELQGVEADTVLATIQAPKEEVVEETTAPAEVEITKGATTEEGKAAAAGEAAPEKKEEK
ncbi:50S ribosomal protein L25 [Candidatus Cerribacteria bacterium 'Amazon FNV 2010 28 9']|uniref:Large ribosomal subunit protein bL25 n=1 Tax=Candidatus Cerribacteria bacterium 'Amazon FNV 2010 28 9' TaxID=2081795 RepID=A0A317JNT9_9BACT|nr:MAG: 50S ribosomal protein L25 [Candidatus Cerribacteria bacterium 'Amazon FNV 2010 28 9']